MPAAAALAPAEALVKETFKAEYARRTPVDQAALAKALFQEVPENPGDAATLYVLLREARDLAAAAGDAETAVEAARGLRDSFKMDAAAAKEAERAALTAAVRAMAAAPATVVTPAVARRGAELVLATAERDLLAGAYAAAAQVAAQADIPARRANNADFLNRVRVRVAAIQAIATEYEQIKASFAALKSNPSDPAACLAAGRFHACTLDKPDRGLPLLAKCSDAAVKSAAAKDLADPATADQQAAVADAWLDAARVQAQPGPAKDWMQRRALRWYDESLVKLEGPPRLAAEKRAKDLRTSRLRRGGLAGDYFLGRRFDRRIFTRVDPKVEFQWRGQRADDALPPEDFSVRWAGWIKSPAAGQYKLIVVHDDSVRVWLDGVLLIDKWNSGSFRNGEVAQFTGGLQELKIEYAQGWGGSHMALGWRPAAVTDPKKTKPVLPENLFHEPPPPGPLFPPPPAVGPDGQIVLPSGLSRFGGARYWNDPNGQKPEHLGHWHSLDAWAAWDFEAPAGLYDVEIAYACGGDMSGSEYQVSVGAARLTGTVTATGWGNYRPHRLGRVRLGEGAHTVRVKATSKPKLAVWDLARVVLTPVTSQANTSGSAANQGTSR